MTTRSPVALTIAGSDCGAGAGIQADLKTFAALGVYGVSAITAITAQNTLGVRNVHFVPPESVAAQIDAVFDDFDVAAIKIGMLGSAEIVEAVADRLRGLFSDGGRGRAPRASSVPEPGSEAPQDSLLPLARESDPEVRVRERPFVICDPVMVASSGDALAKEGILDAIKSSLSPLVDCLTPNLAEAAALLGEAEARDEAAMAAQALRLQTLGPRAVLMKGGHLDSPDAVDLLVTRKKTRRYASRRIESANTHGTGCTLSAAIAAHMALGAGLEDAVAEAKVFVACAIAAGRDVKLGHGRGPLIQIALKENER